MEEKKKRFRPSLTAYRSLESELCKVNEKLSLAERSNSYMESELIRVREKNKELHDEIDRLNGELSILESRGFWSRLFNR